MNINDIVEVIKPIFSKTNLKHFDNRVITYKKLKGKKGKIIEIQENKYKQENPITVVEFPDPVNGDTILYCQQSDLKLIMENFISSEEFQV